MGVKIWRKGNLPLHYRMKKKNLYYLIGIICILCFFISGFTFIKNNDILWFGIIAIISILVGLLFLSGGMSLGEIEYNDYKRNKLLNENEEYYRKMQNIEKVDGK